LTRQGSEDTSLDKAYETAHFQLSELQHQYGERTHILGDPISLSLLARLCDARTVQPEFNRLIARAYEHLLAAVINHAFPRVSRRIPTRMTSVTPRAVLTGELLDPNTRVVCVDIARAGILPSQVCYDTCNAIFDPSAVRQDHLIMSRTTDADDHVTGAEIAGGKIGGPIDGRYVLFPDPMGATGTSLATAISHYKRIHGDSPAKLITLNLIVTPTFVRALRDAHPEVYIYALRLDRGMSSDEVLATELGERWSEESGLTPTDYIVPGGGGFGELMNNSYV